MGVSGDGWLFNSYNSGLQYTPNYYNNTVYKIDKEKGVIPLWKIDFGKYNIKEGEELNRYTTQYLLPMRKDEIDSLIIVCMTNTQDFYWAIYSKFSKRVKVFSPSFKDGSKLMPYSCVKEDTFYFFAQLSYLKNLFNKNNHLVVKYKNIINNIGDEDNYVVVKYKLKMSFVESDN